MEETLLSANDSIQIPLKKIKIEKEEEGEEKEKEKDEKKKIEPVKSSSEILAELFQVAKQLNTNPPDDFDEKLNKKHKHKKRKHKHKKDKHQVKIKKEPEEQHKSGQLDREKLDDKRSTITKSSLFKPAADIAISLKVKNTNTIDKIEKRIKERKVAAIAKYSDASLTRSSSRYSSDKKSGRHKSNTNSRSRYDRYIRSRSRSRSPRRSPSRDLGINKKRLLETARKNVMRMLRTGTLPGSSGMTDEVKDKITNKIRYCGKTVQDLTEFCKKISNGSNLSDISSSEDSDLDNSGKIKPFHYPAIQHPFQIKEKEKIVMKFGNNNNTDTSKGDDKSKEVSLLFPVSSGQQHRLTEGWIPVVAKEPLNTSNLNNLKRTTPKWKPSKELNTQEEQQPAFLFTPTTDVDNTNGITTPQNENNTDMSKALVKVPETSLFPQTHAPVVDTNPKPDVSTIISTRLNAMRRLQTNPMDSEALKVMYNTQRDMGVWAASNQTPEPVKANIQTFNKADLHSGPQAWAHPKQLILTAPLQGGMGMYLLKKMGWQPGEGLGRERNGALEPLLLNIKMDKRGLIAKADENPNETVGRSVAHKKQKIIKFKDYSNKHPVCILNELAAQRKWTPPYYELVHEDGPAHSKMFLFSVSLNGQNFIPPCRSNTKKDAKLLAAKHCLQILQILPPD